MRKLSEAENLSLLEKNREKRMEIYNLCENLLALIISQKYAVESEGTKLTRDRLTSKGWYIPEFLACAMLPST